MEDATRDGGKREGWKWRVEGCKSGTQYTVQHAVNKQRRDVRMTF